MNIINFRKDFAPTLPDKPGVYLMKDINGKIIYVGKAKNIKKRVSSYFSGKKEPKTTLLVNSISSIETIITAGEQEALLLENNLIKKNNPKYNICLKDGKTYPMLCITAEKWPQILKTRRMTNNGSKYFGPFTDARMLDITLELIRKIYPIRRCRGKLKQREFPCLYYHLGQCSGPCINKISESDYKVMIKQIENLITGAATNLKTSLLKQMEEASRLMKFEEAGGYRDALVSLEKIQQKQDIIDFNPEIRDYISYVIEANDAVFSVFQMREGKITGRDLIPLSPVINEEEALSQFLYQYYDQYHSPPERVILEAEIDLKPISDLLSSKEKKLITFCVPTTAREKSILNMAKENCRHELYRKQRKEGKGPAMDELQKVLKLAQRPVRIEGFDIAQLHGKHTVASLITFKNGKPENSGYRTFNIRSVEGKIDDYEAIREAVARRYSRLKNEKKPLPHLIVIDGGPGQVSAANEILQALEISIPLVGLAKREEEVFINGKANPLILAPGSEALRLLQAVRDETHRLATTHSRKKRLKGLTFSGLESIQGVGPVTSKKLMIKYGSLQSIGEKSVEELTKENGISLNLATRIIAYIEKGIIKN